MKFARMLAKTVFTIALIVFIFSSTATARTPSLAIPEPMQDEIIRKNPSLDMGIYPFDSDPARESLLWNVFPDSPQTIFFEKAPSVDIGFHPFDNVARTPSLEVDVPLDDEIVRKTPSLEMAVPLDDEIARKTPSLEMAVPLDDEIARKTPSLEMAVPLDDEIARKTPSLEMAVPMDDEIARKTPSLEMAVPLDDEIARKTPSLEMAVPLDDEIARKLPSEAVREPLNIECCGPTMRFDLKEAASAEIVIFSVDGRRVRRISEALPSGDSSLTWDGRDDRGNRAASGVYFARVQANEETGKGKLVLVR